MKQWIIFAVVVCPLLALYFAVAFTGKLITLFADWFAEKLQQYFGFLYGGIAGVSE